MKEFNIVLNKKKLLKLINEGKLNEIYQYIVEEETTLTNLVNKKINYHIFNHYISEEEIAIFKEIVKENLIKNALGDGRNIFVNNYILKSLIEENSHSKKMRELCKK